MWLLLQRLSHFGKQSKTKGEKHWLHLPGMFFFSFLTLTHNMGSYLFRPLHLSVCVLQASARAGEDRWVGLSWSLGIFTKSKRTRVSKESLLYHNVFITWDCFWRNMRLVGFTSVSAGAEGLYSFLLCFYQLWWIHTGWRRREKQQLRVELRGYSIHSLWTWINGSNVV